MSFEFIKSILSESTPFKILGKITGFSDPTKKHDNFFIEYDGRTYHFTGKTGTHTASRKPAFEYSHRDYDGPEHEQEEYRVWITIDGEIVPD
jgi:hypothetical protein